MSVSSIFIAPDQRLRSIWRFVLSIAVVIGASSPGFISGPAKGTKQGWAVVLMMTLVLGLLLAGFAVLLYLFDKVRSGLLPAMGLPMDRSTLRDTGTGVVFGLAMVSACVGVIAVIGQVRFETSSAHAGTIAIVTCMGLVAAMIEEMVFRGYPFQRLVEAIGAPAAVILLAGLFGAGHLQNPYATVWGTLNTVGFGVFTALAYLRTRSLWLPWGMHFSWNVGLGLGYGLTVSGLDQFSVVVHGTLAGPRWLTGGDYGIEASATATVALLLATVVLLVLVKQRPAPATIPGRGEQPRITLDSTQGPVGGIR